MKVLITYASAGAGHRRVAEAVYNYFKENRPEVELKIVDILAQTNALFRFDYTKGYTFLIRHAVALWHFAFWLTEFKVFRPLTRLIASTINSINTRGFVSYLVSENPDYIISTHFLPSEIAGRLKLKNKISSKLVTIITDFGVHPFWIAKGTDFYVVASDFTKDRLLAEGVPEDKVKVFGLPSDAKFLKQFDRLALGNKLGIQVDKFTVLLMTGSFGTGPLEDIAELLAPEAQVILVCAGNKKLYARLTARNLANVKVFGFVNNAEELMAVSDVIVTKPGGSTIAEILNMELAPIFISMIPGQEEANVRALKQFGIGASPKGIPEVKDLILDLKNHPEKLKEIKERIQKIKKPFSCQELSGVIR
ncbi:MAG: glycosyltransferase [Candidatus Omnitrophica bacterium]|nr:glycosyltransferase [Candidatus Omnitrophota bacterium]